MTIKEFSTKIGVSTATVSRAIRGIDKVSDEKRSYVLTKMVEHGYTPNINARRLVTGRSNIIALDFRGLHGLSDPFLAALADALRLQTKKLGYDMLINLRNEEWDALSLKQWIHSKSADGVLFVGDVEEFYDTLTESALDGTPCVVLTDYPIEPSENVGSVRIDLSKGAEDAVNLAIKLGHTNFGFIGSIFYRNESLLEPISKALAKHNIAIPTENITLVNDNADGGAEGLRRLTRLPNSSTAIFCRLDSIAFGAAKEARAQGIKIPEQLSIIGHDDVIYSTLSEPELTTIQINFDDIAQKLTAMLNDLINAPGQTLVPVIAETALKARHSLGIRAK